MLTESLQIVHGEYVQILLVDVLVVLGHHEAVLFVGGVLTFL